MLFRSGDLDYAVSLGSGEVRLYRNDNGTFVSVGTQLGMPQAGSYELRGLSWGDFDGDGFIDLLGGATSPDKLTMVLHNEGGRHFTDVAAAIGLTIPNRSARQTNWIDYDNDGDLDVYAANRVGDNTMYRNDAGTFTRIFAGVGPTDARPTVGACWLDIDNDGDLDLFLANQSGAADALWRNDGTSFTDVAAALGMTGPPRTKDEGGVGCAIGDDDNDGDLDLSVMSYEGPVGGQTPLNRFFRNDGAAGFVNLLTKDSPLNVADHGVQFVDYDNDGAIDLSVTNGYGKTGGHFVFHNDLPEDARRRSLSVLVLDVKGHHTRFGAEVRLFDRSGRILATRQVVTGGGYNAERAAPVHFGLARLQPVIVEVTFMGKDGRKRQRVSGVNPADFRGKSLVIRQAE